MKGVRNDSGRARLSDSSKRLRDRCTRGNNSRWARNLADNKSHVSRIPIIGDPERSSGQIPYDKLVVARVPRGREHVWRVDLSSLCIFTPRS